MALNILGVDPGLEGGLTLITDDFMACYAMPKIAGVIDIQGLKTILLEMMAEGVIDMAYIEEVHAIFGASAKTTFSFGRNCGALEAVIATLDIPIKFVKPTIWQKEFFSIGGKLKPKERKERCILAAKRLWPSFDFRENDRCKVPHLGKVDSALIAAYGRKQLY